MCVGGGLLQCLLGENEYVFKWDFYSYINTYCIIVERADVERRLQVTEERAVSAEQKLSDMCKQLLEAERRAEEAENRARIANEAAASSQLRTQIAEDSRAEVERKLYEAENELEELIEYKELFDRTQRFSLQSDEPQELCSNSVEIFRQSCNSLSGFLITPDNHQATQALEGDTRSQCSDQLSITSL